MPAARKPARARAVPAARSAPAPAPHRLAKLTRPSARGILPRERLFALLDDARHGRVAWIAAGAGAGKTSLVSSWIEARRLPALWFHIDEADADPATFFHYLALAGEAFTPEQPPLTRLTPEYLLDVPTFTRRFFEALFARLPEGAVLVFDNLHRVPAEAPLHGLIAIGVETAPAGTLVACVSRADPPPAMARWQADAGFKHMAPASLRLAADEAGALCRMHSIDDTATVARLRDACEGWVAGLTLLAHAWRQGNTGVAPAQLAPRSVHDYFRVEVFDRLPHHAAQCLVACSVVRDVTPALANALSEDSRAAALLDQLHEASLFVERRAAANGEANFEFHPLFHEFLRHRLEYGDPGVRSSLRQRAARLLEGAGRIEETIELHLDLSGWPEVDRLVNEAAMDLLSQGRWSVLSAWMRRVPDAIRADYGWLSYWLGVSLIFVDPASARSAFEDAWRAFERASLGTAQLLACSGALQATPSTFRDAAATQVWIDRMENMLASGLAFPSPEFEARVVASGMGLMFFQMERPLVKQWAERAESLLAHVRTPAVIFELTAFAGLYRLWRGEFDIAERFATPLKDVSSAVAASYPVHCGIRAVVATAQGNTRLAVDLVTEGLSIARSTGAITWARPLACEGVLAAVDRGSLVDARRFLDEMTKLPAPATLDAAHAAVANAGVAFMEGRLEVAGRFAMEAVASASSGETPFGRVWTRAALSPILFAAGQIQKASETARSTMEAALGMGASHHVFLSAIHAAWAEEAAGNVAACLELLDIALPLGRHHGYFSVCPWWIPDAMARVLALALDHAIEPDYVRHFIRKRNLAPPPGRIPDLWPFPLRIRTLGSFEVLLDDRPLESGRKLPRRALDLLKVVIAQGGTDVNVQSVVAALWPDAEGDQARGSFDITLHRLRKLLGTDDLLRLDQGRLSLDTSRVWTDVRALEALDSTLDETIAQAGDDAGALDRHASALLDLYRREFLASDDEAPWFLAMRERQRTRFVRMADRIGTALAHGDTLDHAITFVQAASDREPLAEPLHRRLMLLLESAGRQAEALAVYQRCRQMLSILLATAPSRETEAIAARLRGR